jgi:deoxyribodipyrimidine photolyase
MEQKITIFWFRRDLRLHDNAGLYHALKSGNPVLPFLFLIKRYWMTWKTRICPRNLYLPNHCRLRDELHEAWQQSAGDI